MSIRGSDLRDYLHVLWRRKWIVLTAVVIVPAVAIAFSMLQPPRYSASAEVLLSRQNLANTLNNVVDPTLTGDAQRLVDTQTNIAETPTIAAAVLAAAKLTDRTAQQFLSASSVTAKSDADVLVFEVADRRASVATELATLYARQYLLYANELATHAIRTARREVDAKMAELEAAGRSRTPLYADLLTKDQQLATMEALSTGNATLLRTAGSASQVQPTPVRDGLLGLLVGIALGLGLAFLRDRLDTRIRTAAEISQRLGLPLLARLPAPRRTLRRANQLVMIDEPTSKDAEPFRVLLTNLEFVSQGLEPKTIMVTSACQGEGKSTTAANLAVALARTGRRVALVDLDLRRPFVHELFQVPPEPGLTTLVLEYATLSAALVSVPLGAVNTGPGGLRAPVEAGEGCLHVLCSGRILPNPGEFARSREVGQLLLQLRQLFDTVVIDAAPLLGLGDSLALIPCVDALLLVARLELLRRPMLDELHRVLEGSGANPLGIVVTASQREGHEYGYGYGHAYAPSTNGRPQRALQANELSRV